MSFSVGDVVDNCGTLYVILDVSEYGTYQVKNKLEGHILNFYCSEDSFTLVAPLTPVLTGMTQFFKDHKEKTNVTT
jgi:hypothetical protein